MFRRILSRFVIHSLLMMSLGHSDKAQASSLGLGLNIGEPTGLSMKYWLDSVHALDGVVAWNLTDSTFIIRSDYLIHRDSIFSRKRWPIDFYYGIGGRLHSEKHGKSREQHLAGRAPLGLAYRFRRPEIEIYGELAVLIEIIPSTSATFTPSLGGRYFF